MKESMIDFNLQSEDNKVFIPVPNQQRAGLFLL